jgi:hypothetical protein
MVTGIGSSLQSSKKSKPVKKKKLAYRAERDIDCSLKSSRWKCPRFDQVQVHLKLTRDAPIVANQRSGGWYAAATTTVLLFQKYRRSLECLGLFNLRVINLLAYHKSKCTVVDYFRFAKSCQTNDSNLGL